MGLGASELQFDRNEGQWGQCCTHYDHYAQITICCPGRAFQTRLETVSTLSLTLRRQRNFGELN